MEFFIVIIAILLCLLCYAVFLFEPALDTITLKGQKYKILWYNKLLNRRLVRDYIILYKYE